MPAPFNANWSQTVLSDANLNKTTYGGGTTSERNAITTWDATRAFFDTDEAVWYYNSHASAPSSVTWTQIGGLKSISTGRPTTGILGTLIRNSTDDIYALISEEANQPSQPLIALGLGSTARDYGYFNGTFSSYANDAAFDVDWPTADPVYFNPDSAQDEIDFDIVGTGTVSSDATTFDIGQFFPGNIVSNQKWVLRFKMDVDNKTQAINNFSHGFYGMSDSDETEGCAEAQRAIGLRNTIRNISNNYQIKDTHDTGLNSAGDATFAHVPAVETIWVEVIRISAISYTVELFSDAFSTSLELETGTIVDGESTNLRYIKFASSVNGGTDGNEFDGSISAVEFKNGVSVF